MIVCYYWKRKKGSNLFISTKSKSLIPDLERFSFNSFRQNIVINKYTNKAVISVT